MRARSLTIVLLAAAAAIATVVWLRLSATFEPQTTGAEIARQNCESIRTEPRLDLDSGSAQVANADSNRSPIDESAALCFVDSVTGAPVPDATVTAIDGVWTETTDEAGCVHIRARSASQRLAVRHPQYEPTSVDDEQLLKSIPIRLVPFGELSGELENTDGSHTIATASLELPQPATLGATAETLVDATGHFRIERLAAGDYRVQVVSDDGRSATVRSVTLRPGEHRHVRMIMLQDAEIEGRITFARDGRPAPGVVVGPLAKQEPPWDPELSVRTISDSMGRFQFRTNRIGICTLGIHPPKGVPSVGMLSIPALGAHVTCNLVLQEPAHITGRVLTDDGSAMPEASVVITTRAWSTHMPASEDELIDLSSTHPEDALTIVTTNSAGRYECDLCVHRMYPLRVAAWPPAEQRSRWSASWLNPTRDIEFADEISMPDIVLPHLALVHGVVCGPRREPLKGVEIGLTNTRWPHGTGIRNTISAADGTFALLVPVEHATCDYMIRFAHPDYEPRQLPTIALPDGGTVNMRPKSRRFGEVVTSDGVALAGKHVRIRFTSDSSSGRGHFATPPDALVTTDDSGVFPLPDAIIAPSVCFDDRGWIVRSQGWHGVDADRRWRVVAEADTRRSCTVKGRIRLDERVNRSDRALIDCRPTAEAGRVHRLDEVLQCTIELHGEEFEISDLKPGRWRLEIKHHGAFPFRSDLDIRGDADVDVGDCPLAAATSVHITLTDASNHPIDGETLVARVVSDHGSIAGEDTPLKGYGSGEYVGQGALPTGTTIDVVRRTTTGESAYERVILDRSGTQDIRIKRHP